MTITTEQKQKYQSLLERSGLPYLDIKVFGTLRLNIHIETKSRETAEKWALFLNKVTLGHPVKFHQTFKEYANGHPDDTCLIKHKYKIWRVYAIA